MTTAYVTPAQLAAMLTVAKCASTDDMTPILHVLSITVDGEQIVTLATDRYRVGRLTLPLLGTTTTNTDGTFLLPPSLLEQAVKAAGKGTPNDACIKIHAPLDNEGPTTIELMHVGSSLMAPKVHGNFPPVERLLEGDRDDDIPSGIGFTAKFLATMKDMRLPRETPANAGKARWGVTTKASDGNKPGPVMFARVDGKNTLEYFLQPNNTI